MEYTYWYALVPVATSNIICMAKALSFICHVVAESDNLTRTGRGRFGLGKSQQSSRSSPLAFLRSNHMACEACIKLIGILPHSAGTSGKQLDQLCSQLCECTDVSDRKPSTKPAAATPWWVAADGVWVPLHLYPPQLWWE